MLFPIGLKLKVAEIELHIFMTVFPKYFVPMAPCCAHLTNILTLTFKSGIATLPRNSNFPERSASYTVISSAE